MLFCILDHLFSEGVVELLFLQQYIFFKLFEEILYHFIAFLSRRAYLFRDLLLHFVSYVSVLIQSVFKKRANSFFLVFSAHVAEILGRFRTFLLQSLEATLLVD